MKKPENLYSPNSVSNKQIEATASGNNKYKEIQ